MSFSLRFSILLVVFIHVGGEMQELIREPKILDLLQHSRLLRHKRSAVSTLQPHISVHHYHYYYYCCPDMAARVRDDPRLAQAVHNASCGCDKSSCYCQVPTSEQQPQQQPQMQQPHHQQQHQQPHQQQQQQPQQQQQHQQQQQQKQQQPQQQQQQQPHQQQQQQQQQQKQQPHQQQQKQHQQQPQHRQDPFHINQLFKDPFFDFVTSNFVKRDTEKELDECLSTAFDDPICKDFFNFFNQNFMRKPDIQATRPANVSANAPPHTTQKVNTQQPNTQQPQKFKDMKDFHKVDNMFNELENDMKKAFSKTADLGKVLGIRLDDFR